MASAPPRPASPLPSAKVTANTRSTSMPSPRAMRWLSTAARTFAPKRVFSSAATSAAVITIDTPIRNSRYTPRLWPQTETVPRTPPYQEHPLSAEPLAQARDGPAQIRRQVQGLLDGAVDIGRHRHRNEDDADRQQALIEVTRTIEPPIEHALERDAHQGRRQK